MHEYYLTKYFGLVFESSIGKNNSMVKNMEVYFPILKNKITK